MSTKRISIRLAAEGGKKLKAEFQGVGESGKRNLRKISREAEIASAKMAKLQARAVISGRIIGVALAAATAAAIRHSFVTIDAQAKLAASLRTTTESIQVLSRAGELAGVSMGQVEQATIQLTKRLSQAALGTGPAVEALDKLHLSALSLADLPLDERITAIQDAIAQYIPKAEQAAVASQLFGDRAGLIFTRIDSATLRQATKDVRDFELAVSEADAAQIQKTNDALSRMALIVETVGNKIAVEMAPTLETLANKMEALVPWVDKIGSAMGFLWEVQKKLLLPFTTLIGLVSDATGYYDNLATNIGKVKTPTEEAAAAQEAMNAALGVFHETAAPTAGENAVVLANDYVKLAAAARDAAESQLANLQASIASRTAQRDGLQGAWPGADMFANDELAQLDGDIPLALEAIEAATNKLNEAKAAAARAAREVTGGTFAEAAANTALADTQDTVVEKTIEVIRAMSGVGGSTAAAADAGAEAGATVAAAWEAAQNALANYATAAEQSGAKIADTIGSAFSKAESMIAKFVETGKLDFKSLANSIIADLTRIVIKKQILGPLAEALGNIFDGSGGGFLGGLLGGGGASPVHHAGGTVGGIGPSRMMPALAFAGAPRMHNGGWAGLRPDEIPAILQKGERVLSRKEVAASAGGGAPVVNVTIVAKDAESFRQSRTQIAADLAQVIQHGQRGL